MLQARIFICLLSFSLVCGSPKATVDQQACIPTQEFMVIDQSGLDGCGLLLEKPDRTKWLIAENKTEHTLKAGDRWRIGFEVVESMASICRMEQGAVNILCMEKIESACEDKRDPFQITWIKRRMGNWQPHRISKYSWKGEVLYRIITRDQGNYLFNCRGGQYCQGEGVVWDNCLAKYKMDSGKEVIIYQGEGQID